MWYYPASKNWKESNEEGDIEFGQVEVICPHLKKQTKERKAALLPRTIDLQNGLGVMRLRSFPFVLRFTHVFFDSSLFTETRSFCLFFSPIVNSNREEAADGSSTHCRAEGAAVHSSVKRKRKK